MPPLNKARRNPGSILLSSQRAFCFCGEIGDFKKTNSIEKLEICVDKQWKLLPVDDRVVKICNLAAASFLG